MKQGKAVQKIGKMTLKERDSHSYKYIEKHEINKQAENIKKVYKIINKIL